MSWLEAGYKSKLKCNTCNNVYIGQSGRSINVRHKEYTRHIKTNNPLSAYALHISQSGREYGTITDTLQLLKTCQKGICMNCWEAFYRVFQEECARFRESVPYVKVYRYNPKHLYPKLNVYGDNGHRKVWSSCGSTYCTWSADASTAHTLSSVT